VNANRINENTGATPLDERAYEPQNPRPDGPVDAQNETPKWRRDFPIEWGMDNYVTRRDFTKFLILISGATALGNGYFVLRKYQNSQSEHPRVRVAALGEIPVGEVKLFRYPTENDPAILMHLDNGDEPSSYAAYLQRCTHLTCPVLYSHETQQLECPCHHGYFDARTGAVLAGPPPRPLPRIALAFENGEIWAEGIDSEGLERVRNQQAADNAGRFEREVAEAERLQNEKDAAKNSSEVGAKSWRAKDR
jgi:Rieske Fe-S protein